MFCSIEWVQTSRRIGVFSLTIISLFLYLTTVFRDVFFFEKDKQKVETLQRRNKINNEWLHK